MATVTGYTNVAAGTNSLSIEAVMTALHDALIAASWTLEYADANAIGTGSSSDPAWDSLSVNSTGRVVYRMPANGSLTRWYVLVGAGVGTTTARGGFTVLSAGTGHDGSGGLTGGSAGSPISITPTSLTITNSGWSLNASEDGFCVFTTSQIGIYVERARDQGGVVQDEVKLAIMTNAAGAPVRFVGASLGVINSNEDILVMGRAAFGAGNLVASTTGPWGVVSPGLYCIGPYFPDAWPPLGLPRLFRLAATGDVTVGTLVDIEVDGGTKAYMPQLTGALPGTLLVATE